MQCILHTSYRHVLHTRYPTYELQACTTHSVARDRKQRANDLLDHFDSKQSREAVDLQLTCRHLLVLPPLRLGRVR